MQSFVFWPVRILALCAILAAGSAFAATLPLNYVHEDGDASITISGSVTFNDAIWTANQDIFESLQGLTAVSITVSGPGVPDGPRTYTLADISGWVFATDGQNRIVDLNFFGKEVDGCFIDGFQIFLLGFYCGDPEEPEEFITLKRLVLAATGPAKPVPALDPAMLALLAGLLAAATALAAPALLRRRR